MIPAKPSPDDDRAMATLEAAIGDALDPPDPDDGPDDPELMASFDALDPTATDPAIIDALAASGDEIAVESWGIHAKRT